MDIIIHVAIDPIRGQIVLLLLSILYYYNILTAHAHSASSATDDAGSVVREKLGMPGRLSRITIYNTGARSIIRRGRAKVPAIMLYLCEPSCYYIDTA